MQKKLLEELTTGGGSDRDDGGDGEGDGEGEGGDGNTFSTLSNLMLAKLIGRMFPVTDFRHVIITPLLLLCGHFLSRCSFSLKDGEGQEVDFLKGERKVVVGLFLCNILGCFLMETKRYMPEVLNFIFFVLRRKFSPQEAEGKKKEKGKGKGKEKKGGKEGKEGKEETQKVHKLDLSLVLFADDHPNFQTPEYRFGLLNSTLNILEMFLHMYGHLACFHEVFTENEIQILRNAHKFIQSQNFPEYLLAKVEEIMKRTEETRQHNFKERIPLAYQTHAQKPKPLREYNPRYNERYSLDMIQDPDKDRASLQKLKYQHKQEMKGAMRELRKDSYVLQQERMKEREEQKREREEKRGQIMQFLEAQEHDFKELQKEKKKLKL
eukprot:TRINITY_DN8412_c0_g1_i1.p1 TRINITY_DN8412_c0_g1~~TRINITY_DN8412_c0_g1_i1.p1  ORF type:complete len:423 (+),score=178.94 TRINITY_DN8412_c0_g1_i1:133-1269(+)